MVKILTTEEKTYLKRICRYLGSLGMKDGNIEIDVDGGFDCDDINWSEITHFSNNYTAEVPHGLVAIFKKILEYLCENDLIRHPDADDLNYERLVIDIDCDTKEISVKYDYNYYTTGDTESVERSVEDDSEDDTLKELFDELESDEDISDRSLELEYNGSGDSGYIEDYFSNGDSVPSYVEDYCYGFLESNFGGWEINEGSQGRFLIDMDEKRIALYHTMNIEENERDTFYEESFA